jgi:hypothetical protein
MLNPRRHHRRRRNPGFAGLPDLKGLAMDTLYLAGGGITARSLPQLLVAQYNTGWMGYGMNLLTTAVTAFLVGKWQGQAASRPWLLGGFAFTLSRIIDDYAGLKILSFAQYTPPFQLAGDATYGMRGVYASLSFPLPSNSLAALPAPAVAVPVNNNGAPVQAGMGWDNSFN